MLWLVLFAGLLHRCYSILGVEPTFNISDLNVTVTTYRHPISVNSGTNEQPVTLGPIHSHKSFDCYYILPSTFVRFSPTLNGLKAF